MRKARGHIPVRTCISCGMKRAKGEMVRLVTDEAGFLFRDKLMRKEGRGAYVCDSRECGEDLLKNKRLQKVFRRDKPVVMADVKKPACPAREHGVLHLSQDAGLLPRKRKEF
jgi:predicted RNA-binding protein YlxR (DUF448 family)